MPFIFGIHQFSEGLIWLGINGSLDYSVVEITKYFYNFIAMCFWPVFIPLAILLYEFPRQKRALYGLLATGTALSLYLLWCFTVYSELLINVNCCNSIAYIYRLPWGYGYLDALYVFLVVMPFLLSKNRRIRWALGPGFFITFLIALAMESGGDYPSIWCFFAAILSIINYWALLEKKSRRKLRKNK